MSWLARDMMRVINYVEVNCAAIVEVDCAVCGHVPEAVCARTGPMFARAGFLPLPSNPHLSLRVGYLYLAWDNT